LIVFEGVGGPLSNQIAAGLPRLLTGGMGWPIIN
jgi:hypothetical protein